MSDPGIICADCSGWPALDDALGCCPVDTTTGDADVDAALWDAAQRAILNLVPCWQVCTHSFSVIRPCRCPIECNPCGCRVKTAVPWLCAEVTGVTSQGFDLDPADWNVVGGYLWPTSCFWPCQVTVTVAVGSVPPDGLVVATKALWCRMVDECKGGSCELPEGTVTVRGPDGTSVTILTFDQLVAKGLTGLRFVDRILTGYPCPKPEERLLDPADWAGATIT